MNWLQFLTNLLDERAILEASALAFGSSISSLFYFLHRRFESKARTIEDAPGFELNKGFVDIVREAPFSSLPYVAINGSIATSDVPLRCHCNETILGVAWRKSTKEHKDVWGKYTRVWQNEEREISSISENIPFSIKGYTFEGPFVNVLDPLQSAWFEDCLSVVSEDFVPSTASTMESIVGFVSGDRLKGYTHTEKMLRLGTKLCAIGEVVYENGLIQIKPPSSKHGDYIISHLTRSEIVSKIRSKSILLKIFAILTAGASLTAVYFIARRLYKKFEEKKEQQRLEEEMELIRNQRTIQSGHLNRNESQRQGQEPCVVCLENPRECVILNCGHVCICVDCLAALPSPKECPVCRSRVVKTIPLFNA